MCIYSVAERLYKHIKQETFQTRTSTSFQRQARIKQARKLHCARNACSSIHEQRCRHAHSLNHFISNHERNYKHACCDQLSHEVNKMAIKAAIKLCMHVLCYIWVTLRTCLLNGFHGASQHCLPHLTHQIQLVSSLGETELGQKR